MTENELKACEANKYAVTLGLIDRMAKAYRQTRSALLRAKPPPTDPPPQYFRSVRGVSLTASEDVLLIVRDIRRIQRAASEVIKAEPRLFARSNLNAYMLADKPDDVATKERRALGFKHDIPPQKNAAQAYHARRILLEQRGILVFQKKWSREEGLGISLFDNDCPPSIVVNTDHQKDQAKSFTVFHEYAHLLLRQPGVSDQRVGTDHHAPIEQWCNRVAAAILMPRGSLLSEVRTRFDGLKPKQWELNHIGTIASRFRVSYTAAGIRLKNCGVTDAIDRLEHHLRSTDTASQSRPKPPTPQRDFKRSFGRERFYEVGPELADLFLNALRDNIINTRDAGAILDLTGNGLRSFEAIAQTRNARPDSTV